MFLSLLALVALVNHAASSAERPIIGVLTTPLESGPCETLADSKVHLDAANAVGASACFNVFYVQWIEAAGARVAVIPFDATDAQLENLLNGVDGVLFTGGGLSLELNTTYDRTAMKIFHHALRPAEGSRSITLWGTCMGFQLLNVLAANDLAVLSHSAFDSEGISWPLNIQSRANSRMWSAAPSEVMDILTTENVTVNLHHDGVTPQTFEKNNALTSTFRILSTNFDRQGKEFVSTIEAINAPIYGVQWHPERPQFEWTIGIGIRHSRSAIIANAWPAAFFIDEARRANHSFTNETLEADSLIYKHRLIDPRGDSYAWYVFGEGGQRLSGVHDAESLQRY